MDNASKALIMAGAILISVAIVGIGIYIFSSASSLTTSSMEGMDSMKIQLANQDFTRLAIDKQKYSSNIIKQLVSVAESKGFKSGDGKTAKTYSVPTMTSTKTYTVTYAYDEIGQIIAFTAK